MTRRLREPAPRIVIPPGRHTARAQPARTAAPLGEQPITAEQRPVSDNQYLAINHSVRGRLDVLRSRVILAVTQRIDRRPELRAACLHRNLERPCLPLVVPALRPQPLGFLEIFLRRLRVSVFEQVFAEAEICRRANLRVVRRYASARALPSRRAQSGCSIRSPPNRESRPGRLCAWPAARSSRRRESKSSSGSFFGTRR